VSHGAPGRRVIFHISEGHKEIQIAEGGNTVGDESAAMVVVWT